MTFELHSPAFRNGGAIPDTHARDGDNKSPPLRWTDPPRAAKSFALIMEDADAPSGGAFHHWVVHSLGPDQRELRADAGSAASRSGRQGLNDFGAVGYDGPEPPPGDKAHRYRFRLLALDLANLQVPDGADAPTVENAVHGHVIAETEIIGAYRR